MAFFRKKNKKININTTEISSMLSKLFRFAFKNNIVKHRDLIFKLTKEIYDDVDRKYGQGEVLLEEYYQLIKSFIPKEMAYLNHNFDELFEKDLDHSLSSYKARWSLKLELKETIDINNKRYDEVVVYLEQKTWLDFFEDLSSDYIDKSHHFFFFEVFKEALLKNRQNMIKTSDEWFDYFCNIIKHLQNKDPRIVYLLQALHLRKKFCALLGIDWLPFVSIGNHIKENRFELGKVNYFKFNNDLYKKITEDYFLIYKSDKYDLSKIIRFLDFKKEYQITYLAEHILKKNNALLKIFPEWKWKSLNVSPKETFELVQWTFLRAAIKLTLKKHENIKNDFDKSKNIDLTDDIVFLYQQLSQLDLILPPSLLRELNKNIEWNLNKNFSYCLKDDYDDIQKVIFDSITTTKWTGSVCLDLSRIRKKDSPIRNGLRKSNGIKPYVDMLNNLIKTQGRIEDEKPISVSLPIWHIEFEALFSNKNDLNQLKKSLSIMQEFENEEEKSLDELTGINLNIESKIDFKNSRHLEKSSFSFEQDLFNEKNKKQLLKKQKEYLKNKSDEQKSVIQKIAIVPDYFMWHLYDKKKFWYLLDQNYFEEQGYDLSKEDDYLKIEQDILEKRIKPNSGAYKRVLLFPFFQKLLSEKFTLLFLNVNKAKSYSHNLVPLEKDGNYFNFGIKTFDAFKAFKDIDDFLPSQNIINVLNLDFGLIQKMHLFSSQKNLDLKNQKNFNKKAIKIYSFNEFVDEFNKNRKDTNYLTKLKDDLTISEILSLNIDEELCYLANIKNPLMGCKKSVLKLFENGQEMLYHTPDFILFYHENFVYHDVLEKYFLKESPFNFESFKNKQGVSEDLGKDEFNFKMQNCHFSPFFKQGMMARCKNHFPLVINTWLKGVSGIELF